MSPVSLVVVFFIETTSVSFVPSVFSSVNETLNSTLYSYALAPRYVKLSVTLDVLSFKLTSISNEPSLTAFTCELLYM